jgi:8-oxo-dGTP pyrophosphatase MutT (NUDIX family)
MTGVANASPNGYSPIFPDGMTGAQIRKPNPCYDLWHAPTPVGQAADFGFFWKAPALPLRFQERGPGGSRLLGYTGRRCRGQRNLWQAAIRELREETGIRVKDIGPEVARRELVLQLPDVEHVMADERYFLVKSGDTTLSREGWTVEERKVMADYKWWSQTELAQTSETVWPEDLLEMLRAATA